MAGRRVRTFWKKSVGRRTSANRGRKPRQLAVEHLEARHLLAVLSNTPGDGTVSVNVDGFGAYGSSLGTFGGNATYDPVGPIGAAGTTYLSGLSLHLGGTRQWLATGFSTGLPNPATTGSTTVVTSTFSSQGLSFELEQRLSELFVGAGQGMAERSGSLLTQTYRITNTTASAITFDLYRYVDGDLSFNGSISDGGGRLPFGESEILFETDSATGSATESTFVGITAEGGTIPATNRFEISGYSGLRTKIQNGTALSNAVAGDGADADQFVDAGGGYDMALALRNHFEIAAGASEVYITRTIFGTGNPDALAQVASLTLSPQTAERPATTSHTVTATALDDAGEPVPGARIEFAVTGANPTTGFAFTDFNGVATFPYIGSAVGTDTIQATAGLVTSQSVQVSWLPISNLVISNPTGPNVARRGASIDVGWTVSNVDQGVASAPWSDAVYLSTDGVIDAGDILLAGNIQQSADLGSGEQYSRTRSVTIPGSVALGNYFLLISTDISNAVFERSSSDNVVSRPIQVTLPDLVVESPVAVSGGNAVFGSPIDVSWAARNQGLVEAVSSSTDRIWLSADNTLNGGDLILANVPTGSSIPLIAGGVYSNSSTVNLPLSPAFGPGTYYIIVETDATVAEPESNDANNWRASEPILIESPPLPDIVVTSITAPANALSNGAIPISWEIRNNGDAPVSGVFQDRVYLSADNAIGEDTTYGTFEFQGTILPGQAITRTQNISLPPAIEGNYYVVVTTDVHNQIFEQFGGETNNSRIDDQFIDIDLAPFPNLVVDDVIAPPTANSGQQVVLEWVIENVGNGPTQVPNWRDYVYLSLDQTLDGSDVFLGSAANPAFLNVGDSYRNSISTTLPEGIDDDYYFIVVTDANGQVLELNAENDNRGVSDIIDIDLTPPPDLQVTTVQAPGTAFSGQTVTVNWTVTNEGTGATRAPSGNWNDRVYLSLDNTFDAGDTLLSTVGHSGNLVPGEDYDASATVTLPIGVSGSFFFIVRTDVFNQVFEHAFEGNNAGFDTTPTTVNLTPPPDLEVELVNAPAIALSGRLLTVNYRVGNFGATATPNSSWQDSLYLSSDQIADSSDLLLQSQNHFGVLDVGGSYEAAFSVVLPNSLSGTFYAIITTDSGNLVFELDNANNVGVDATPIVIESRPADLVASGFSAPTTAKAGSSILVDWLVMNNGIGDTIASTWFDRIVLSTDATVGSGDITLANVRHDGLLDIGAGYDVSKFLVELPFSIAPGSYFLLLSTDHDDRVYEGGANGNNTAAAVPISITRDTSDVQVTAVTASANTQSGGTLTVNWTVENTSPVATNANHWFDAVYLSSDGTIDSGDRLLGEVQHSNPLAPGGQYSVTRDFQLPQDLIGQFFVIVRTDSTNLVVEGPLENNNDRATQGADGGEPGGDPGDGDVDIDLSQVPDLVVAAVNAPAEASSGQPVQMQWTVRNVGPITASRSWYDAVYLSLDQVFDRNTDTFLGFANAPSSLASGATYQQTASFNIPQGLAGTFWVFVAADSGNHIFERNSEFNNSGYDPQSMLVRLLPPADFTVGNIVVPANGVSGQTASVTYTVRNQGDNSAQGTWVDSVFLSADNQWDINDALLGRVTHVGEVAGGGSYTETLTAPVPGVVPGNYHVIIRSDILNRIPESSESNNIGASLDRAAIDFPELTLGVPTTGTLAQGQSAYYRVTVPAGETLSIDFDSQTSGAVQLFASFGTIPTSSNFQYTGSPALAASQQIRISESEPATLYILVRGDQIPEGNTPFRITTRIVPFGVLNAGVSEVGAGAVTLLLEGSKFTDDTSFTVVDHNGQTFTGSVVSLYDPANTLVAFNFSGAGSGLASIVATNGGETATLPDAFTITPAFVGDLQLTIDGPGALRAQQNGAWTIRYANAGGTDIELPVIYVQIDGATFVALPGSTENLGAEFLLLGIEQDTLHTSLRPGASGQLTVYGQVSRDANASVSAVPSSDLANVDIDYSQLLAHEGEDALPVGSYTEYVARLGLTLAGVYGNLKGALGRMRDSGFNFSSVQNINGRWHVNERLSQPLVIRESNPEPPGINDAISVAGGVSNRSARRSNPEPFGVNGFDQPVQRSSSGGDGVNNTIVIVIGMEDYTTSPPGYEELNDTSADADAWADTFRDYYGVDPSKIVRIKDRFGDGTTVTETTVTEAIRNSGADGDDTLVIAYSGHGSEQGSWVMNADGDGGYISSTELANAIQASGAGEALVISDSCYSGQMIDELNAALDNFAGYAGTDTDSLAWEGDDLSLFTEKMIEELRNGKTFDEAFEETEKFIAEKMKDKILPDEIQDPTSVNEDGVDTDKYDYQTWSEWLEEQIENGEETIDDWTDQFEDWLDDQFDDLEDYYDDFKDWLDDFFDDYWDDFTDFVQSFDPNDIVGPAGFGAELFVPAIEPLDYTIRFENDPLFATAPAQQVRITQQLDSDLDFRTFRVGDFGFGDVFVDVPDNQAFINQRVDAIASLGIYVDVIAGVNVSTGEAFWDLTAIDPTTGEIPADPLRGFLPPNLTSPEGEGFVSYSIRARSSAQTGDVVDAAARIIFDINEPIDTPPIFNTLDAGIPVSSVVALAPSAASNVFDVAWSGLDDEGGSGVADNTIYVSENDGPFQAWLTNTQLTSAEYVGVAGNRYSFYSVARDNAGNVEAAPAVADAVTVTPGPAPQVTGVVVQDGMTQRSYVDRFIVDFSGEVNLQELIANGTIVSAVTLTNLGVNTDSDSDQQISLTPAQFQYEFDDSLGLSRLVWSQDAFATAHSSLLDGFYKVTFKASLITDVIDQGLDGNADGIGGDDYSFTFHRLSGDANGDRTVNTSDMQLVNAALGSRPGVASWNENVDLDRDGVITTRDRLIVSRGTGGAILPPTTENHLAGDYNNDAVVDAADYIVWRKIDGTQDGYNVWRANLGNTLSGSVAQVWQINFGNTAVQVSQSPAAQSFVSSIDVGVAATASFTEAAEFAVASQPMKSSVDGELVDLALATNLLDRGAILPKNAQVLFRVAPRAVFQTSRAQSSQLNDRIPTDRVHSSEGCSTNLLEYGNAAKRPFGDDAVFDVAFDELFGTEETRSRIPIGADERMPRWRNHLAVVK